MADERRALILVVEDDPIIALDETETLGAAGYEARRASSAAEALAAVADSPVDLVLMDVDLGSEPDGLEAAVLMQRDAPRPILFLTARDDAETYRRIAAVPAYGILPKCTPGPALVAAVGTALRMADAQKATLERERNAADRRVAEAEARTKEAHHRVRNNIATLRAIMSMQLDGLEDLPDAESAISRAASAVRDAIGRLDGMAALHEILANGDGAERLDVRPYMQRLVATVEGLFPASPELDISQRIDDFDLDAKRALALGIIMNELLTNIMKYAFAGRPGGSIAIDVCAYDESVIMTLRDDGIGLPEGFEEGASSGLGLSLVSILLDQFEGTLAMRSDAGTVTTVLLKAPGLRPAAASRDLAAAEALMASARTQDNAKRFSVA